MKKVKIPDCEFIHIGACSPLNELSQSEPTAAEKEAVRSYMQCSALFYRGERIDCYVTRCPQGKTKGSGERLFDAYIDLLGKLGAV